MIRSGITILWAVLSLAGGHHHRPTYFWPAMDNCTVGTLQKNGVFRGTLGVVCVPVPAHWASTPPPPMAV